MSRYDPMRIRHGAPEPGIYVRIVRAISWQRVAELGAALACAAVVAWVAARWLA